MSTEQKPDPAKAVLRVLKTGIHRGGNVLLLSLAACAIASLLGLPLLPAFAALGPLLELLKGSALGKVLERIAFAHDGNDVTDAQINAAFDEALARTNLDALLTDDAFQRALARQMRELHIIEMAVKEGDGEIVARILAESRRFDVFADEMRVEFQRLYDRLGTLATSAQAESIIALLNELLARNQTRPATALHQLPSPPGDFTGREGELAQLRAAFDPSRRHVGAAISGLRGMGGVGKTALGLVIAHELRAQYHDAQLFFDLRGQPDSKDPATPAEALSHVIRAFAPDARLPDDEAQLRAIYLDRLSDKRALVVMDNARDAAQVAPLVPPPSCALLVTSRQTFTLPGMQTVPLDSLPQPDAEALLLAIAPRIGTHAPALAIACACLPYALRIAGDYLANSENVRVPAYLADLQTEQGRLGLIEGALALSYNGLSADQQLRWRQLAVFPDTFEELGAAAVWGIELNDESHKTAAAHLGELLRYSLITYDAVSNRYHLHDLARVFAAFRLDHNAAERDAATVRHARHYANVLSAAQDLYFKGGDAVLQGLALYDRESANIVAGQSWAAGRAAADDIDADTCDDYAGRAGNILALRLYPRQYVAWLESGLVAARRLKRRQSEGAVLGNLGGAYYEAGDARKAIEYSEQNLVIAREIGDRRGEGAALGNLGIAYADLGDLHKAIDYHTQALAIAHIVGDDKIEGTHLGNLGVAYKNLGDIRQAIAHFEQALAISRQFGNRRGEGGTLGNLGLAYADLGELREAIDYHEQSLAIHREIGDRRGVGSDLSNLGVAHKNLGDARKSIDYHEQSLAIRREIGDRRGVGGSLGNLGGAYYSLGDVRKAINYYEQALAIAREIGDRLGEGIALGNLGGAYYSLGDVRRAIDYYEQALAIAREISDRNGEGRHLGNLGVAYKNLGDVRRAIDYYEQALAIDRKIGDRRGEGGDLFNLALGLDQTGDRDRAIAVMRESLRIRIEIEDPHTESCRAALHAWGVEP